MSTTAVKQRTPAGSVLRTGRELVAMKDACIGGMDLCDERIAELEKQKTELQQRIDILTDDRMTLAREMTRLCEEVKERFEGEWFNAEKDTGGAKRGGASRSRD